MLLADLLAPLDGARLPAGAGAVEIAALAYDSRRVAPGALYFCVPGEHSDGHDFAPAAVGAGAAALAVQRPLGLAVPEVVLRDTRAAMGPLAARFYGEPTRELQVVGVTGTNGKTTTAFLLRALMEATGTPCGLLGTVTAVVGGRERPVTRTTAEAIDLQADFRAMLDSGDRACAIEVSSHALALHRTAAARFAAAIFTNLTLDHLDFHPTLEDYYLAKRALFLPGGDADPAPRLSVVNLDDPHGRRLAAELPTPVTFAIDRPADYRALDVRTGFEGCRLQLVTPAGERCLALPLRGRFNVANALGALAAAHALGGDLDTLVHALERGVRVPGRLEAVDAGQDFAVLVDYAHTPDSLQNVLLAARELVGTDLAGGAAAGGTDGGGGTGVSAGRGSGRVLCVFGAGGDRDRSKRPLMGEIAARLADVVIVTSDNPRSEDPEQIIAEILAGAARARALGASPVVALADRRAAIERAVGCALPGDVLVIAGKGHEQGQQFAAGRTIPFDDVTVARHALRARLAPAAGAAV